jgi:hypothetical protein
MDTSRKPHQGIHVLTFEPHLRDPVSYNHDNASANRLWHSSKLLVEHIQNSINTPAFSSNWHKCLGCGKCQDKMKIKSKIVHSLSCFNSRVPSARTSFTRQANLSYTLCTRHALASHLKKNNK